LPSGWPSWGVLADFTLGFFVLALGIGQYR